MTTNKLIEFSIVTEINSRIYFSNFSIIYLIFLRDPSISKRCERAIANRTFGICNKYTIWKSYTKRTLPEINRKHLPYLRMYSVIVHRNTLISSVVRTYVQHTITGIDRTRVNMDQSFSSRKNPIQGLNKV